MFINTLHTYVQLNSCSTYTAGIFICFIDYIHSPTSLSFPSPALQYGGEEHLSAPPKELLLAQTEQYVEYSRSGAIIKGQEKARVKSRYEEDVYINNHTVSVSGTR